MAHSLCLRNGTCARGRPSSRTRMRYCAPKRQVVSGTAPVTGITPLPSTTSLHQLPPGPHQPIADAMASHHQGSNHNANEVWRMSREAADAARAARDLRQAPVARITTLPPTSPHQPPPGPHQPPQGAAPLQPPGAGGAPVGARCPLATPSRAALSRRPLPPSARAALSRRPLLPPYFSSSPYG